MPRTAVTLKRFVLKKKSNGLTIFYEFLGAGRKNLLFAFACALLATVLRFVMPQIVRFLVDNVFQNLPRPQYLEALPDRQFFIDHLYILALAVIAVTLVRVSLEYLQSINTLKSGEILSRRLRNRMFSHIQSLPFSWHSTMHTGDIIQRSTLDADMIKRFVSDQLVMLIQQLVMMAVGIAVMFYLNPLIAAISVAMYPAIIIFSLRHFKVTRKKFQEADEAEGEVSAALQENLTATKVVRAFGQHSAQLEVFKKKSNLVVELWEKFTADISRFWALSDILAGLQMLSVLVAGAFLVADGSITIGVMLSFMFYIDMIIWPLRNFGRILGEMSKTGISLKRIQEIFDAQPETDAPDAAEPKIYGDIEFKNVGFSYTPEKEALKDISFKLKRGQTLGIVGGTGGGKSTIAYLLSRLYDADEGQILIDGRDITTIRRAHVRKNIALVLQEPFLFSRTLRENICIICKDTDEENMRGCACVADLDCAVCEFEHGYDTIVGERGVTLSGGQRQRVAIARTLISSPPVIIFDDSLSAVDTETDINIRRALKRELKGTTVVLISHRITTVMHSDLILVIDGGSIADMGTHNELTQREGIYKRIYDLQVSAGLMPEPTSSDDQAISNYTGETDEYTAASGNTLKSTKYTKQSDSTALSGNAAQEAENANQCSGNAYGADLPTGEEG